MNSYLRGDDEKWGLWVQVFEGLGQMGAINVWYEVNIRAISIWLQGFCYHQRTLDENRRASIII